MTSEIDVHIKKNDIRNIDLNICRDIRDYYYGEIFTIVKNEESGIILLNGKLKVILCSILKS